MIVERAHRSLGPRPIPGAQSRPIIAKLLNYADRDAILREARQRSPIVHQGNTLLFFPDHTPAVQAARREFTPTKRILQKASIPYSMLYPAKLKITHDGQAQFFTDAKSALKYAKHISKNVATRSHRSTEENAPNISDND